MLLTQKLIQNCKCATGQFKALLTSRALNEGVDVPEAKVAIILGGSASAQEYAQRLVRIIRMRANKRRAGMNGG